MSIHLSLKAITILAALLSVGAARSQLADQTFDLCFSGDGSRIFALVNARDPINGHISEISTDTRRKGNTWTPLQTRYGTVDPVLLPYGPSQIIARIKVNTTSLEVAIGNGQGMSQTASTDSHSSGIAFAANGSIPGTNTYIGIGIDPSNRQRGFFAFDGTTTSRVGNLSGFAGIVVVSQSLAFALNGAGELHCLKLAFNGGKLTSISSTKMPPPPSGGFVGSGVYRAKSQTLYWRNKRKQLVICQFDKDLSACQYTIANSAGIDQDYQSDPVFYLPAPKADPCLFVDNMDYSITPNGILEPMQRGGLRIDASGGLAVSFPPDSEWPFALTRASRSGSEVLVLGKLGNVYLWRLIDNKWTNLGKPR